MRYSESDITGLLKRWQGREREALDELMPLVFDEVRAIARRSFAGESPGHTLEPTGLAIEAYLRLAKEQSRLSDVPQRRFENREQFFAFLARLMRHILVDHARHRQAAKRGGKAPHLALAEVIDLEQARDPEVRAVSEALDSLRAVDPRQSRIVELRFFVGLTLDEVAQVLGLARSTVCLEWQTAKAWLLVEMSRTRAAR